MGWRSAGTLLWDWAESAAAPNLLLLLVAVAGLAVLAYILLRLAARPGAAAGDSEPAPGPGGKRAGGEAANELHASDLLEVHKLRRDRRVPVTIPVTVRTPSGTQVSATSREISAGGMSMEASGGLDVAQPVELEFILPPGQPATVRAVVWWRKGEMVGVRFDYSDECRLLVKTWLQSLATQTAP